MLKQVICYHHNTIKNKVTEIDSLLKDVQAIAKDILESTNFAFADVLQSHHNSIFLA